VDLNPAGSTDSYAYGISGAQQVGRAMVDSVPRASLWSGTAASWVDLNPAGSTDSQAKATTGGQQAGYVTIGGVQRASIWSGTAASWTDLSTFLTGSWSYTYAQSIWSDGTTTNIAGYGNSTTLGNEALLWTYTVPEPSTAALLCIGALAAIRKRRCRSTGVLPGSIRNLATSSAITFRNLRK
jgi:hypothetical protein